jgi:hypothetical protein
MATAEEIARNLGLDEMPPDARQERIRELLSVEDLSVAQSLELDVLLLMAAGLSEVSARARLLLTSKGR